MTNPILTLTATLARLMPDRLRRTLYRYPGLARRIRRALNRAAPQGLTRVQIAAGPLAGMNMDLDLQSEKDYWLGTYETELLEALRKLAQEGMTAYDLGANIGYISLALARVVGEAGKVHSFEALRANVARLKQNLAANRLESRVQTVHAAVVDRPGEVTFHLGPSHGTGKVDGAAGRDDLAYGDEMRIPGLALDDYVYEAGNPTPDLVKMDIEGGEVLALAGMRRVLAEARPVMLIELHGPQAARAAWEALTTAGYRIYRMAPGFPAVTGLEQLDWKAYVLAFPGESK